MIQPPPNEPAGAVATFTFFRFSGFWNRYWAFSQMGLAPRLLRQVPGLTFFKLLGSGDDRGFGMWPNFGLYALLGVWTSEGAAQAFLDTHPLLRRYRKHAAAVQTLFLKSVVSRGTWDGKSPFEPAFAFNADLPVAVLTRASIRWRRLWAFWRQVPAVSFDVANMPGLVLAVGIGEAPLMQQATFSLWRSGRDMFQYAYQRPLHTGAIGDTRRLKWYSEELFARFWPYRVEGAGIFDASFIHASGGTEGHT